MTEYDRLRKPQPGDRVHVEFDATYSRVHSSNGLHWVDRGDGNALVPAGSVTVLEPANVKPEPPAEPDTSVRAVLGASGELYVRAPGDVFGDTWETNTGEWTWPELVGFDGPLAYVSRGDEIK